MKPQYYFLSLALFLVIGCSSVNPNDISTYPQYTVDKVLSGDTVLLDNGEKVRYSGIVVPKEGDIFSQEAKERNKSLVEGKKIAVLDSEAARGEDGSRQVYAYLPSLVEDIPLKERAYIRKETKVLYYSLQCLLLQEGLAKVSIEPDEKSRKTYEAFQKQASAERRGIWAVNQALNPKK